MTEPLMLVVLYHEAANLYSIAAHNQTPVEAEKLIQDRTQHLNNGDSLRMIAQRVRHNAKVSDCRTCRIEVRWSPGLIPSPRFTRRNV